MPPSLNGPNERRAQAPAVRAVTVVSQAVACVCHIDGFGGVEARLCGAR
jgi:hypothetical protein